METQKKKILLFWGYNRKAWVNYFDPFKDQFDFVYLFHLDKAEEKDNFTDLPVVYWKDYTSAQEIIRAHNPDKIIFMGVTGVHTIALNRVAQKKGIPTAVLQHGMFHSLEKYLQLQDAQDKRRAEEPSAKTSSQNEDRNFLLKFYFNSLGWFNLNAWFFILKMQLLKRRMNEILALSKLQSKFRMATEYWVFTIKNAEIYQSRDGVPTDKMRAFGNPEIDDFVKHSETSERAEEAYYLLVDQSFAEIKAFNSPGYGPSKEAVLNFYSKLADFAKQDGRKLKVKLHPYSYESDFFEVLKDNIEFVRDAKVLSLVMNSDAVFGFFSSLMAPAIYYKPCVLFRMFDHSDFINRVENLGLAQVLEFDKFKIEQIELPSLKPADGLAKFAEEYIMHTDGKNKDRLRELLAK